MTKHSRRNFKFKRNKPTATPEPKQRCAVSAAPRKPWATPATWTTDDALIERLGLRRIA